MSRLDSALVAVAAVARSSDPRTARSSPSARPSSRAAPPARDALRGEALPAATSSNSSLSSAAWRSSESSQTSASRLAMRGNCVPSWVGRTLSGKADQPVDRLAAEGAVGRQLLAPHSLPLVLFLRTDRDHVELRQRFLVEHPARVFQVGELELQALLLPRRGGQAGRLAVRIHRCDLAGWLHSEQARARRARVRPGTRVNGARIS